MSLVALKNLFGLRPVSGMATQSQTISEETRYHEIRMFAPFAVVYRG